MVEQLRHVIQQYPTFGYRQLWALLRGQMTRRVNKKAVYRVLRQKRQLVHQRSCTPRPRVQGWVSRTSRSDEHWAMDVTHIPCGQDGQAHLATVIDCHDREIVGYEFALHSRAKEAERAIEAACLQRFGTLRPVGAPVLRSDNGLIFQSRRFVFQTFEEARRIIQDWMHWYNHGRPHSASGYRSPMQYRAQLATQVA